MARLASPPFLQIRWQVRPGAQKFLDVLRPNAAVGQPVLVEQDFTNLQGLSRQEQQKPLSELAQRGERVAAIHLSRWLYGCGLEEAQGMIEDLKIGRIESAQPGP